MGRTLALMLLMVAPAFAQEPPSVQDQIDPTRFDDGSRAIVVRLPHRPEPGEPTSIQLVKSRAYVRRGDAGPILVEIVNRAGRSPISCVRRDRGRGRQRSRRARRGATRSPTRRTSRARGSRTRSSALRSRCGSTVRSRTSSLPA